MSWSVYVTHDDPGQTAAAMRVVDSLSSDSPGFISLIVLAELVWVLAISYRYQKKEIEQTLDALLHSKELMIERKEIVLQLFRSFRTGPADFAECKFTITFDQKAARVPGMRLLG